MLVKQRLDELSQIFDFMCLIDLFRLFGNQIGYYFDEWKTGGWIHVTGTAIRTCDSAGLVVFDNRDTNVAENVTTW